MKDDIRLSTFKEWLQSSAKQSWSAAKKVGNNKIFWLAMIGVSVSALTLFALIGMRQALALSVPVLPSVEQLNRGVMVYDNRDRYVCTLRSNGDRKAVPLNKISKNMIHAAIASEDRRFFHHHGVDPIGIARAFWRNRQEGRIVEGASTITQQVVRNLYLSNERSYVRKLKEVYLAWDVESNYPKEKILETYLNVVYFGGGVCGVERAAQHYFNKHAEALSVPESAYLTALIKAPSTLDGQRAAAIAGQKVVIEKMAECGFLTDKQARDARASNLAFQGGQTSRPWPYYVSHVEEVLTRELGDDLWKGGWKVYTNLDVEAQTLAEKHVTSGVASAPKGIDQGALVTMSLKDGAVLAIVGGAGPYKDAQWNRAVHPHTAGSAFKPFVYLAGLIKGVVQEDTMLADAPVVIEMPNAKPYAPRNFDGKYKGWMTARAALAASRNVCAVRVAQQAGIASVVETAQAAGIHSQLDAYPALALGCCAVTPMEMASAYGTLARGGVYMPPQVLRRIVRENGEVYRDYQATPSSNLPFEQVAQLVDLLQDVVKCGTGSRARLSGVAVAGKTGTANDAKDIWFCGFTPDIVTAVWAGNDLNKKVRGNSVTGGTIMAKIWHDYMSEFVSSHPPETLTFKAPERKLIAQMPQYANEVLLGMAPIAVAPEQGSTENGAIQPVLASETELNAMVQNGVGRAFDLQRLVALQRQRMQYETAAAANNGIWTAASSTVPVSSQASNSYYQPVNNTQTQNSSPASPADSNRSSYSDSTYQAGSRDNEPSSEPEHQVRVINGGRETISESQSQIVVSDGVTYVQ